MSVIVFPDSLPPADSYLPPPERILAGEPTQRAWVLYTSADGRYSCGIWECARGKWRVVFDEHEFCRLESGELVITADDGRRTHLRAGDVFVTPAGFTGTWEVLEPARKLFTIYT